MSRKDPKPARETPAIARLAKEAAGRVFDQQVEMAKSE